MKVSLATQIFSESMYTAYLVYKTMFPDYFRKDDNNTTLEFIIDMDKLFDTLNSSLKKKTVPNKLNYAITKDSEHIQFLKNMSEALEKSKFEIGPQPACIKGFILTINSVLQLFEDLSENYDIQQLCTRKLIQDPLENLFSVIRQQHGCSVNPSPKQFQTGLRHIFITQISKVSGNSNCETDKNYIFTKLSQLKHTKQSNKQNQRTNEQISSTLNMNINVEELNDFQYIESETKQFTESNTIYYICGYLAKKFLAHHACTICEGLLISNNNNAEYKDHKLFTLLKTYEDCSLVHVTENIYQIIMVWEKQFQCVIRNIIHKKNLAQLLTDIFTQNCPIVQLCCPESSNSFLYMFIRIRCHWEARIMRRNIITKTAKNTSTKMKKFI